MIFFGVICLFRQEQIYTYIITWLHYILENLLVHVYKSIVWFSSYKCNRICALLVNVLASSAIDRRFESWSGQTKDYKICISICCFSSIYWERAKTGWHRIRIKCLIGVTCLSTDLFQWASTKNPTKHVSLVQSRPHHLIGKKKLAFYSDWLFLYWPMPGTFMTVII